MITAGTFFRESTDRLETILQANVNTRERLKGLESLYQFLFEVVGL